MASKARKARSSTSAAKTAKAKTAKQPEPPLVPASSGEAISYEQFVALARDASVPERELRAYVTIDRALSRPMRPAVHLDPALVRRADGTEVRTEGAMDWANGFCRWRRQDIFRRRGDAAPILVSEGDSWFQFPFLLEDVIDQLGPKYRIWSVDAAGDTLSNMAGREFPEYVTALTDNPAAKALLFSGGGNDLVGEDSEGRAVLERVLRRFDSGQAARWHLATTEYAKTLQEIEGYLRDILSKVASGFPGLPVFLHGYDYAIPGPAPNEWRRPVWAGIDQWLGRPLRARGFVDHDVQREIIGLMIDDLNALQIRLCGNGSAADGRFKDAYHIDLRGTLKPAEWADELHPTDDGFAKVAKQFLTAFGKAGLP